MMPIKFDESRSFHGQYRTARGRLAAFLSDLSPLFRRLLTGSDLTDLDVLLYASFRGSDSKRFRKAERKYRVHLSSVLNDSSPDIGQVLGEFLDNTYRAKFRYGPKRGAPRKRPRQSQDVIRFTQFSEFLQRLRPGCDLAARMKRKGGFASDDSVIAAALAQHMVGYTALEVKAILTSRGPSGAAVFVLANGNARRLASTRASISVGRRKASPLRSN